MNSKKELLSAMRAVAGTSRLALELVDFLEQRGADVPLVADEEIPREWTEGEFQMQIRRKEGLAELIGVDLPETYAEYLALRQSFLENQKLRFKLLYPDGWDAKYNIALVSIPEAQQKQYLVGTNLVTFQQLITVGIDGSGLHANVIHFAAEGCSALWLGFMGFEATFVARESILHPVEDNEDLALKAIGFLRNGTKAARSETEVLRQRGANLLLGDLINAFCGKAFLPMLDTVDLSKPEAIEQFVSTLKFLEPGLFPATTEFEEICRGARIRLAMIAHRFNKDAYVRLFSQSQMWASEMEPFSHA